MLQLPRLNRGLFEKLGLAGSADILNLYAARAARGFGFAAIILPAYLLEQFDADEMATYGLVHPLCWRGSTTGSVAPIYRCQEEKIAQRLEPMALRLLGHIELPAHRSNGGFDHADIHAPTDRLYVAHTSNDSIDVIDCARDRYIESIPDLTEVAGALVSETRGLVFTSNRGENTISAFAPSDERNAFKIAVGVKPNGLAFDPTRGLLIAANVGDPSIPDSYSVSVVDLGRRERTAEVKVPGRTRWAIYDATLEMFFVNIASPARIVAIDARDPTKISTEYEIPAAGPHGLDLDPAQGRLLCACDAGVLFAIEARSGRVLGDVPLSGAPDVIFLHPKSGHLYVAIGDPGVIDVIDIGTMRCKEVVPTEAGAHTLALDRKRSKVYSFLPQSHRAAIFVDTA